MAAVDVLKICLAPLLGGVIGYITNDIAIKMLFHPRKSYYIGKFHIPFTPGLIPQQKSRIAKSVGHVVSMQLLNAETLKDTILSQRAIDSLQEKLQQEITKLSTDTRTLRDLLELRFSPEEVEQTKDKLCGKAVGVLMQKLTQAHIGSVIADSITEDVKKLIPDAGLSLFFSDMVAKSLGNVIEKVVEDKIQEKGPELLENEISQTAENLLELQLCELYQMNRQYIPKATAWLVSVYREALDVNLEKVLSALDIENIIVEKISAFDAAQLEGMIFGILNRELKAIVYLGAALGFLMGFINLLL